MKSFDRCMPLLLLAVFLITMAAAYPLEEVELLSPSGSVAADSYLLEAEGDQSSTYDDEIISHVVEIVNLALDTLQP